jgi:hypothetical protein
MSMANLCPKRGYRKQLGTINTDIEYTPIMYASFIGILFDNVLDTIFRCKNYERIRLPAIL